MTWVAAVSVASAAVALHMGLLSLRFGAAPGWRAQRTFAWVALTAAGAIATNVVNTLPAGDAVVLWFTRVQLAVLLLHAAAWLRFASLQLDRPMRWERWVMRAYLAAAPLCLVPGVAFGGVVQHHRIERLGVEYADVPPTPLGAAFMVGIVAMGAVVLARYHAAWRRGSRSAGVVAASLAALTLMGVNDALTTSGLLPGVYLVDLGFLVPIAAVAYDLTARFAREARDLAVLRDRLEALVDARTSALREASQELIASERTTAMARLSAGVAQEIDSPAAALGANLGHLLRVLRPGEPVSAEARATLEDVRTLAERIVGCVRRLVDASRVTGAGPRRGAEASLAQAVDQAVDLARFTSEAPRAARVRVEVPGDLRVAMDDSTLTQLLGILLRWAARHGSPVIVEARRDGGVVRLRVVAPTAAEPPPDDAAARELATVAGLAAIYGGTAAREEGSLGVGAVVTLLPVGDGCRD